MKVWELIAKLSEVPAGADVLVGSSYTEPLIAESYHYEKDFGVTIACGDPVYVDNDGETQGPLSKIFDSE